MPMNKNIIAGSPEDLLVILTKQTLDVFLREDNSSDLIGLYVFYYYTAKWQKTNQPQCTDHYVMNGLSWGKKRLIFTKKKLIKLGLISQIHARNTGKFEGWYIRLNYIFKAETVKGLSSPVVSKATSGS